LRIRWNLQDAIVIRKPGATDSAAAGTEEAVFEEEEPAVIYSPTPPRPRKATPQSAPPPAPGPAQTEPPLYEEFTDEPPVRTSAPASVPYPTTVASNGNDPDGYDPANFEPVQLREVDPATIDLSDFSFDEEREPPTVPPPAEELAEPTVANDSPPIPQPRGGTEPATPDGPPPPTAWILPHGASRGGTGLGATLPVADLARSLHFYHDQLGFTIAYTSPESAVVELEGTRILLEHVGDAAGREPQYDQVHMAVGDIDATCASLAASGVDIIDPPATADANDGPQLWRATLSDPDGHEVELVEWRVPRR
jgi:catechol 2,3-dioxygenase-like lactoylglutathione lyase family enzyme